MGSGRRISSAAVRWAGHGIRSSISSAAVRWAGHGIRSSHLQCRREVGGSQDPVVASPGTSGYPRAAKSTFLQITFTLLPYVF